MNSLVKMWMRLEVRRRGVTKEAENSQEINSLKRKNLKRRTVRKRKIPVTSGSTALSTSNCTILWKRKTTKTFTD